MTDETAPPAPTAIGTPVMFPCPSCAAKAAEIAALKAEVERLREALEKIIREAETIDEAEAIAREALEEK